MSDEEIEITPEKGDIVRHANTGVEYVFYGVSEKTIPSDKPGGTEKIKYSTWLMQEPNGKLSTPYVVLGGFDAMQFVERGAPREPGERPVRPLVQDINPAKSTLTANHNDKLI